MKLRTRFAVLTGAALLAVSGFFAVGVAGAEPDDGNPSTLPFSQEKCHELPVTGAVATQGDDVLEGTAGADVIDGLGGNDVIRGLGGNDRLNGGPGNDLICAGTGDDEVRGGPGNDTVWGEPDDDKMWGGFGEDWLIGGPHNEGDRGDGEAGVDACPTTEITVSC